MPQEEWGTDPGPACVEPQGPRALREHPVLSGLLFALATFTVYQIGGGILMMLAVGGDAAAADVVTVRVVTVVSQGIFLLGPALLVGLLPGGTVRGVLRVRSVPVPQMLLAVIAVVSLQAVIQGWMLAQDALLTVVLPEPLYAALDAFHRSMQESYVRLSQMHSPAELAVVWLVIAMTPAFCEEAVFRGVVLRLFGRALPAGRAVTAGAFIFAVFHFQPLSLIPLFLLGLLLGFLAWRADSLVPAIVGHLTNNTIAVISVYLLGRDTAGSVAQPEELSMSLMLIMTLTGAILCLASCWMFRTIARPTSEVPPISGG